MTADDRFKHLEAALARLAEHCDYDAIQIMATWCENGCTHTQQVGVGNWHARQGMAHEFITSDIAQENAHQIARRLEPPDA